MGNISLENKLTLFFCLASYFFTCVAISIPSPFLPRESELHGQDSLVTGIMLGLVPFEQCFINFMWSKLAAKIGIRNVLKAGTLITSLMTTAFASIQFIPHSSSTLFAVAGFGIRILLGFGTSAVFTSAMTIATDLVPEESIWLLSIVGAVGGVGMISGPAIGSGLFKAGGFWLVFVATGGLMFLVAVAILVWLPQKEKDSSTSQTEPVPYRKIISNPRTLIGLTVGLFSAACWTAIDPILEPELRNSYGLTEEKTALVFLLLSGVFVIATPIAGKLVGKSYCIDSLLVMVLGLSISLAPFLLSGPCPLFGIDKLELWMMLVCLSVLGLTNCLLYVPGQDLAFNLGQLNLPDNVSKTSVRSFISACWNTFYSFGSGLGMVYSGALAQFVGWAWTMTSYAGACIILILVILMIKGRETCIHYSGRLEIMLDADTESVSNEAMSDDIETKIGADYTERSRSS